MQDGDVEALETHARTAWKREDFIKRKKTWKREAEEMEVVANRRHFGEALFSLYYWHFEVATPLPVLF